MLMDLDMLVLGLCEFKTSFTDRPLGDCGLFLYLYELKNGMFHSVRTL